MTTFGEILRTFREMTHDPDRHQRPLSQARLGELMGHIMEDRGFSGAAVSHWERGENKISADDRRVLVSLVNALYRYGGIKTLEDANRLVEAGNYRTLNQEETHEVFGEMAATPAEQLIPDQKTVRSFIAVLLEILFSLSENEVRNLLDDAEKGPFPSWPRVFAALLRRTSERISFSPKAVLWIGIWGIAWWLIAPSLRWPFATRGFALQAIGLYMAGTLVIPLLIGMLIDTRHNEYWEAQGLARSSLLRLYTYQGAGIGFNLGYFFILPFVLLRHCLNLKSSSWLEFMAVTVGLILGDMSARVVPHNLWLAYRRLHFADGAIFFVVAFLGPLWGIFFLEYYSVLLTPFWGSAIILVALLLFIMMTVQQSKKIDSKQAQS
jgi:hypothetical protein